MSLSCTQMFNQTLETKDSERWATLIRDTPDMNMQIHDWTLDEIDISLSALPTTDRKRIGCTNLSHTHIQRCRDGSASFHLKCQVEGGERLLLVYP